MRRWWWRGSSCKRQLTIVFFWERSQPRCVGAGIQLIVETCLPSTVTRNWRSLKNGSSTSILKVKYKVFFALNLTAATRFSVDSQNGGTVWIPISVLAHINQVSQGWVCNVPMPSPCQEESSEDEGDGAPLESDGAECIAPLR